MEFYFFQILFFYYITTFTESKMQFQRGAHGRPPASVKHANNFFPSPSKQDTSYQYYMSENPTPMAQKAKKGSRDFVQIPASNLISINKYAFRNGLGWCSAAACTTRSTTSSHSCMAGKTATTSGTSALGARRLTRSGGARERSRTAARASPATVPAPTSSWRTTRDASLRRSTSCSRCL